MAGPSRCKSFGCAASNTASLEQSFNILPLEFPADCFMMGLTAPVMTTVWPAWLCGSLLGSIAG